MTAEELQAKLEDALATIAKLNTEKSDLVAEKRKTQAHAEAAREEAEKAAAEAAAKNGDIDAIKAQHAKELKKLQEQIEEGNKSLSTVLIDRDLQTALVENNVDPRYHKAVTAMMKADAKLEGGMAKIGDVPLADYVKSFVGSDEGKAFVAAPLNSGSNATGSQSGGARMTKETWSLDKLMQIHAENPAEAKAIAVACGQGHLFS